MNASAPDQAVSAKMPKSAGWVLGALCLAVAACWLFPRFWYVAKEPGQALFWLTERTNLAGWQYRDVPVSQSAENVLVADRLVSGEFSRVSGEVVRVFSAKRYVEKENDIGLFVHTPDRCWTEAGWKIDPVQPDFVELSVQGRKLGFERRVLATPSQRELVYFGGLVGGQPLPYRLDHNLSVGMRYAMRAADRRGGAALRASDARFWQRVWDSFVSRQPLLGPKQFIRLSAPVRGDDLAAGDRLLAEVLGQWLTPADFRQEMQAWRQAKH
jgi:hypothetical protein